MSSGGTQTSTTSSGPPPQVLNNYQNLVSGASSLLGQPLNQYSGPMVEGFNPTQQAAFSEVANAQGAQSPYINAAAQEFGQATTPLWPQEQQFSASTVNQYQSPYTQDVTQSLQNLYGQQNAQQLAQVAGNATSAGAYGGDREAVAQALTAQQQQLAEAPTLAQTEQQGYQTSLGEFNTQQQQQLAANEANAWLGSQAGFGMASLGNQAQTGALSGASALLQTGGEQQQLGQEQLNIPYEEFQSAQAYPYQQLSFLSPIIEGTGSLSGGTGTTTYPGQSTLSQVAGLGLTGLGAYGLASNSGLIGGGQDVAGSAVTDFGGGSDLAGFANAAKRGGRIGLAAGGLVPEIPILGGAGSEVPSVNLGFIPTGLAMPQGKSSLGLSVAQPDVSQTTTASGGSNALGDLGALASIAKLGMTIAAMAMGGHVRRDDGGSVTVPGQTNLLPQQQKSAQSGNGLPAVPQISLDHIIHPGPEIKGSGPPKAPNAPAGANNQFGVGQATSLVGDMKSLKGLGAFGGSAPSSDGGSAKGGRIGLDSGGSVPLGIAAAFGGAPPTITGAMQQLAQMPLTRLQEMAVQFPPTSQQGQLVAMAIRQKQATPGSGTTQPSVTPQPPQQQQSQQQAKPGLTAPVTQPPQTDGTSVAGGSLSSQQMGGTSSALAEGGSTGGGSVTPDELDPLPVVDHSGDTVKLRFPSEGKMLDLGIPSVKRRALAAGGASGTFGPSITAPNGVSIPQLNTNAGMIGGLASTDPLTGQAYQPGGGSGNWNAPLAQYQPPGTTTGPGGSTQFPSTQLYSPGVAGVANAFGITVPQSLGGPAPGATPAASSTPTAAQLAAQFNTGTANPAAPPGSPDYTLWSNANQGSQGSDGGGKRGGNASHFDDGGDVGDDLPVPDATPSQTPIMQRLQEGEAAEIGAHGGLYSPPPSDQPAAAKPDNSARPSAKLSSGVGLAKPPADIGLSADIAGLAAPLFHGTADSGEPSPPQAMATPDRAPPDTGKPPAYTGAMAPPSRGLAAGATPARDTGMSSSVPPTLQGIDPSLNPIVQRESGGQPYVGYTSPATLAKTGHATDLRNAPVDDTGAPIWEGDMGPAGVSHAFGPAQIEPGTWRPIAKSLGITDWRAPGAYAEVANTLHASQGDTPWAASAPRGGRGLGSPPGADTGDQVIPANSPGAFGNRGGVGLAQPGQAATDEGMPARRHGFDLSDYSMPLLIAGLSTLGSRSPNALAEGFRAAAPYFTADQRAQTAEQNSEVRQQANQNVAAARSTTAQIQLQGIQERADAAMQRSNDATARLAEASQHNQVTEALREQAQTAQATARDAAIQLNIAKAQLMASETTPQYGPGPSDPNNPNSQKTNGTWYLPKRPDKNQPNGGAFFVPGVGAPKQATGEAAIYQDLVNSGAATDEADAVRVYSSLKRDPRTAQNSEAVARLVGQEAANLRALPTNANATQAQLEAQARRNVVARLGIETPAATAQPAPQAAPAAQPAGQPAAAQPQQKPAATPHPAVIQNGWRYEWNGSGYQPTTQVQ